MSSKTRVSIGSFQAVFKDVQLPFGLTVAEVHLGAPGALLESDPFSIDMPTAGTIEARVGEKDLEAFLEKESPGGLKNFSVRLHDGKVIVKATAKMIFEVEATALCTLRIVDGKFLYVDLESVEALGMSPTALVEGQLSKINPILDVSTFPLDITLQRVELQEGVLYLHGTAKPKE